jgi:hypothetical protein
MRWGDEHLADAAPPVELHHSCGALADPVLVCGHCNKPMHPHDVTPVAASR